MSEKFHPGPTMVLPSPISEILQCGNKVSQEQIEGGQLHADEDRLGKRCPGDWRQDAPRQQVYSGKGTSAWSGREASFAGASCISAGEKHKNRNAQPVCQAWLSSIKTQFQSLFSPFFFFFWASAQVSQCPIPPSIHRAFAKEQKSSPCHTAHCNYHPSNSEK